MSISKSEQDFISQKASELRSRTSDRVRYFFLNPTAEGAGKHLRPHRKQVRLLLTEMLRYFFRVTMHPPASCESVKWWEKEMEHFLTIGALVFGPEEFGDICADARGDVYYGAAEYFNQHPDVETAKKFFEWFPQLFGKEQPTQEEIGRAIKQADARWEESGLCEEESPFGAELRQMRDDDELGLDSISEPPPDSPNELR